MLDGFSKFIVELVKEAGIYLWTIVVDGVVKKVKERNYWTKLIICKCNVFISNLEKNNQFLYCLKLALSKQNIKKVVDTLRNVDGYKLKKTLINSFMELMENNKIPHDIAEAYAQQLTSLIIEEQTTKKPEMYDRFFMNECKEDANNNFLEIKRDTNKILEIIAPSNIEKLNIKKPEDLDTKLKIDIKNLSIGIDFFTVDDPKFKSDFERLRYNEVLHIRGRSREETIYCVLNELRRLNDCRKVYIVENIEAWKRLLEKESSGNVYIPWIYEGGEVPIENNTNIFIKNENYPKHPKDEIFLRPRTISTLRKCLINAGLDSKDAHALISDTHGLYSEIKNKIFSVQKNSEPEWVYKVSEKAKKTCLLVGSWEEVDGDKLAIEALYEDTYDKFIDEISKCKCGEEPLIYIYNNFGSNIYYLANVEITWYRVNLSSSEKIWKKYESLLLNVLSEDENLLTYKNEDMLRAYMDGEQLFWSDTIRQGMLNTLLIKCACEKNEQTNNELDILVTRAINFVKTEKHWIYISKFWQELCEISPDAVIRRLDAEWNNDTGLLSLFKNQAKSLFESDYYIDILFGIEILISQKDYFWKAYNWLLKLDSLDIKYRSNSPGNTIKKVLCTWINCTRLQTSEDKIKAAKKALEIDRSKAWEYIFSLSNLFGGSVFDDLCVPKYREHYDSQETPFNEIEKTKKGYLELLLSNMDCSVDRWRKIIDLSREFTQEKQESVFKQLLNDIAKMQDEDIVQVKYAIRSFIYKHRYHSSASWAMPEDNIKKYVSLLDDIHCRIKEYEYSYLFKNDYYTLLNPVPYEKELNIYENKIAHETLIKEKLIEFQAKRYDLSKLVQICAIEPHASLGTYLAKYWNSGKWDISTFEYLLALQDSGQFATDYLNGFESNGDIDFGSIINELISKECPVDILVRVYRIEAFKTKGIPLISDAKEDIKKEFWQIFCSYNELNASWILSESKKYSTLGVYLNFMHYLYRSKQLNAEKILNYFDGIENMQPQNNDMTSYYVEELVTVLQDAYINDASKRQKIASLEVFFAVYLKWEKMKCFQHVIKESPEIFAYLVSEIFKKDHQSTKEESKNTKHIDSLLSIYRNAHFCPAEIDGKVDKSKLQDWIDKYEVILKNNDQESLFTATLGRLFAFSPLGDDGYEPCETVRDMIEKYGDTKMASRYHITVLTKRGVFSPSAGEEEKRIAEDFKEIADYLEPNYPKTADIYKNLYKEYMILSEQERIEAENER